MKPTNDDITRHMITDIDRMYPNMPDFAKLGKKKMGDFIRKYCKYLDGLFPSSVFPVFEEERSEVEMEYWCKETYSNMLDAIKEAIETNPEAIISINGKMWEMD